MISDVLDTNDDSDDDTETKTDVDEEDASKRETRISHHHNI